MSSTGIRKRRTTDDRTAIGLNDILPIIPYLPEMGR